MVFNKYIKKQKVERINLVICPKQQNGGAPTLGQNPFIYSSLLNLNHLSLTKKRYITLEKQFLTIKSAHTYVFIEEIGFYRMRARGSIIGVYIFQNQLFICTSQGCRWNNKIKSLAKPRVFLLLPLWA
jgi:hypothetical protein